MKKLILRFTIPLTLILFVIITKWSYGIVINTKDIFFYGFPKIYKCEGFHTSMSTQYFLSEMIINLLTYFVFSLITTLVLNRFMKINISKRIAKAFWIVYGVLFIGFTYFTNVFDDQYLIKRNFDIIILESGISIFGIHSTDRENIKLKEKNNIKDLNKK